MSARNGLQLRKGPGIDFGITKTLDPGAKVNVLGFDGQNGEWARVDLHGDGLIDGHVHSVFLTPADDGEHDKEVEESLEPPQA